MQAQKNRDAVGRGCRCILGVSKLLAANSALPPHGSQGEMRESVGKHFRSQNVHAQQSIAVGIADRPAGGKGWCDALGSSSLVRSSLAAGIDPGGFDKLDCIEHVQLPGPVFQLPLHLQQRPGVARRRRQLRCRRIGHAAGAGDAGQFGIASVGRSAQRVLTHPHIRTQMAVLQTAGAFEQRRIAGFTGERRAATAGRSAHYRFLLPDLAVPALPDLAPCVGFCRELAGFVQESGSRLMPSAMAAW